MHEPTAHTDWLTVEDAAAQIKASRRSLYRAIRAGELRAAPINGRGDLRTCRAWVSEWMSRRADARSAM